MLMRREPDAVLQKADGEPEPIAWYDHADTQVVGPAEESWDLRRHLRTLRERRWLAGGIPVVALAIAGVYLYVAVPEYQARAKLLIDSQSPNVVSFQEVVEQNTAKLDYYETQVGILRSRTLARTILDRLKLWDVPELVQKPSNANGKLDRFLSRLGFGTKTNASARPGAAETAAQSHVIDAFVDRLSISYRAGNRLFDIAFSSKDPQLAATVANTLAQVYIDQNLDRKVRAIKEASDWLNARLVEQRRQVEATELALQRYREDNADVSLSEQQNIIVRKLAELSTAATTAKTERIDAESLFVQVQKVRDTSDLSDALPIILSNTFVQQLKTERANLQRELSKLTERLGDRHPDVVRVQSAIVRVESQLRSEIAKVAQSVGNQVQALRAKERSLGEAVALQERLALALDRRGIQYSALQREVTSNRQIFEALLDRAKQTEISSELKVTNIQIVDPAEVPLAPAAPRRSLILALALLLGLPLGVGAAICVEYLDDRIKSPDEIKATLGVKFLGFAPAIPRRVVRQSAGLLKSGTPAEYAEALRTVRANVFMHTPAQASNSVLVTSTGPGEGKTIVAANLAIALAQAGRRTLLIDADMRRCTVHELFEQPLEPGLAGVLNGVIPIADAIRPSDVTRLSVLTAGNALATPGDLLELPAFANAISSVKDHYDWIVIDSPPVMAASDAMLLAQTAAAVIFVVGSHMTTARHARAALEQLDGAQSKIIGAVLSRGKLEKFGDYSHRVYAHHVHN
jgi:succinoglycan biosynthesis transport protein ExoP